MLNNLNIIVSSCRSLLLDCPEAATAREELNKRISKEIQEKFEFGFFPPLEQIDSLCSISGSEILLEEELLFENEDTGEIKYSSLSHHNLVLPYKDVYGNVLAIVGRSLLTENERKEKGIPKYKNTAFKKSRHLFNLNHSKTSILQKDFVYIVEGQFDAIKATECGIENIVAVGSSNLSFDQFALLLRYTNNLHLLFDNDEAGEAGRKRALEKFGKYANINNDYIPAGFKDVDEFLSENDIDNIKDFENSLKS